MAVAAVIQRPLRGSRVSTFYPVKTLPLLSSLDSAFQLQEYISLLIRHNVHDVERIVTLPGKPGGKDKEKEGDENAEAAKNEEKDSDKVKGDVTVDEACWIYEQLRRLAQDLTHPLITMLQQECSRTTCPEMKAGEWLYLCVAHGTDGAMEQCCAIDYILHTLDSATALLNSPRAFPSRLQIPPASHRHFTSLARRLGRIFAHAYFHHRDIFAQAEAESSLYARFLALTTHFDLVPPDFIVVPPTKVITDAEADENDIPRHSTVDKEGEYRPSVIVPDPAEVQPPRLLAASLEPQTEREKEKGHAIQQNPSAPSFSSATAPTNPTIRILNSRGPAVTPVTTKNRNPPSLFVSNNGLIPLSGSATAAPTTAASLFASSDTHLSTTSIPASSGVSATGPSGSASSSLGVESGMSTLATGQESPRRASRPRTDTMVYSEGYTGSGVGNGRGSSPIPIVRLGARLNEPEKKDQAGEKATIAVAETPIPTLVTKESGPSVVEERREETALEKEEPDFVPIDDEMGVIDVTEAEEGKAESDGDPPPVSEGEQDRVQTEPAVILSEPEVEPVPFEGRAQPDESAQLPLLDQGQPEQTAVETSLQPSQVELVDENGSTMVVGEEEVGEASYAAEQPDEVADETEQEQTGENTLVDGSSAGAIEHDGLGTAENSDANVAVEEVFDKEGDRDRQQS